MTVDRRNYARDRRNYARRGQVIDRIVSRVVRNPSARFTFARFRTMLGVPEDAARRILGCLTSTGLLVEVERGIWARSP
jgi:Fic family protein